MNSLRGGIALLALVTLAGTAIAQDPSVNESDFNTTADEPDESYLNESSDPPPSDPTLTESDFDTSAPPPDESYMGASTESSDPTLSEGDFDTSVPTADESYLGAEGASDDEGDGVRDTPGPALVGLVAAAAIVALTVRRK